MTVADASVWISGSVAKDLFHASSLRWLQQEVNNGREIYAPVLLLAETSGAVARRGRDSQLGHYAVEWLLRVPALRIVPVDNGLGAVAARLAADLSLRGADAVYVALAYHLGAPLVSWDAEQLQRGRRLVAARTP